MSLRSIPDTALQHSTNISMRGQKDPKDHAPARATAGTNTRATAGANARATAGTRTRATAGRGGVPARVASVAGLRLRPASSAAGSMVSWSSCGGPSLLILFITPAPPAAAAAATDAAAALAPAAHPPDASHTSCVGCTDAFMRLICSHAFTVFAAPMLEHNSLHPDIRGRTTNVCRALQLDTLR